MDYRVLKGRPADRRGGIVLRLTERVVRFERGTLALIYCGLWLLGLVYVLALVWR